MLTVRLGNMHVPCGCDARKEVMFDKGNIGVIEGAILAAAAGAVILAWKVTR